MPLGESMLTSLRSNKRKNVNDAYFKYEFTSIKGRKKGGFNHKTASPELLQKIRADIKEKRQKRNKKLIYISSIICIVLAICLWYLKD